MFTPSGRRSGKIMTELEHRGLKAVYEPDGKTLKGFQRIGASAADDVIPAVDAITDHLETRHPWRTSRWKTKRMNSFYKNFHISRKSVVFAATEDLDESIDQVINKRMAKELIDDEPGKLKSIDEVSPDGEEPDSDAAQARQSRNARAKEIIETEDSLNPIKKKLKDGVSLHKLDPDERAILRVALEYDDEVVDLLNNFAKRSVGGTLKNGLTNFAKSGVQDTMVSICSIRSKLNAAIFAARVYRARAYIKYAAIFITSSDQTRLGKVSAAFMGELMKRPMKEDGSGRGFGGSQFFKYLSGGKFSKSKNDEAKIAYGVDGKLTGIAKGVNDTVSRVPGTSESACEKWNHPAVAVGTAAIELAPTVFSGGTFKAGSTAVKEGLELGFREALEKAVKSKITSTLLKSFAIEAVKGLSFEAMLALLQIQAEKALSLNSTGQEVGGDLADQVLGGGGTMNKQRSLAAGLVPATTTQYTQALKDYKIDKKEEIKGQSFYARVFDYNNPDSFAFNIATTAIGSPMMSTNIGMSASILTNDLLKLPLSLVKSSARIITGSALAEDTDEIEFDSFDANGTNLATDPAGNIMTVMRDDIESIDPEQNIKDLVASGDIDSNEPYEPKSDRFKNHIASCVDNLDILSEIENGDKDDCMANKEETKKFKAHLAYMDMVDGVDAYLFPDEIEGSSGGPESSGTAIIPGEGLPWPLAQTKAEADSTQGSCIQKDSRSVCKAGHPYIAYDLFAPQGTQIRAVSKGEVISAKVGSCGHGKNKAFTVSVFDSEKNTTYFYQHMDPDAGGVKKGDIIKPGDPIGKVGPSSAACDTNPHLHIDASAGRGRSACSRQGCSDTTKAKFIDIGPALFKGYEVLQ